MRQSNGGKPCLIKDYDYANFKLKQLYAMLLNCTGEAFEHFNESLHDEDKHNYLYAMVDLASEIKSALKIEEVSHVE